MGALASTDSLADMEAGSYRGTPPFPNPCAETRGSLFASALKGGGRNRETWDDLHSTMPASCLCVKACPFSATRCNPY